MGGRLGVWKEVLWLWFYEWRVAGVLMDFSGAGKLAQTRASDGSFLGNFEWTPAG